MKVSCPECGTKVALDESASASDVCPDCGAVVRASAKPDSADWRTTSLALKTQFAIVLILLIIAVVVIGSSRNRLDNGEFFFFGWLLIFAYFICICTCGSAPEPTARRSAIACALTIVFGTVGILVGGHFMIRAIFGGGRVLELMVPAFLVGIACAFVAAFVFLMRFHASVAKAFGNRRLRRECYVFMSAPVFAAAVNSMFELFRFPPRILASRNLVEMSQIVFNFAFFLWYAVILFRTFRTIDRGRTLAAGGFDSNAEYDPSID